MTDENLEEKTNGIVMEVGMLLNWLQRLGPKNFYSPIRESDSIGKYPLAPVLGFTAGFLEGMVGRMFLPSSLRIFGEEITTEYFDSDNEEKPSIKVYDRIYNDFRILPRVIITGYTAFALAQDPQEHKLLAIGAGLSLAYEGFRGIRNYLSRSNEEADAAFED